MNSAIGTRLRRTAAVAGLVLLCAGTASAATAAAAQAAGGDLVWARRYGTAGRPASAVAVAAVPGGGACTAATPVGPGGYEIAVLRYRGDGRRQWVRTYGTLRQGEERAAGVAVDRRGNVLVAGSLEVAPNDWDLAVIKYAPDGRRLWLRRYAGPSGADAHAVTVRVDRHDNVFVCGTCRPQGGDLDVVVARYTPDGQRLWLARRGAEVLPGGFALPGTDLDPSDMALDAYGNAYVCGSATFAADRRALLLKVRRIDGSTPWARMDDPGPGVTSEGEAVAARDGLVALAATVVAGSDWHMAGLGYGQAGTPRYRTVFNEGSGSNITASDVGIDHHGATFVSGVTESLAGATQACAMRLRDDGSWESTSWEPLDGRAGPVFLALGPTGAVYLTWRDQWMDGATEHDNILVRRFSNSLVNRPWMTAWRGPGHGDDRPAGMVLGATGGLYVAGTCQGTGGEQAVLLRVRR